MINPETQDQASESRRRLTGAAAMQRNWFQPGQSGNLKGRKPRRTLADEVKFQLGVSRGKRRREIAQALVELAAARKPWALKLICGTDIWGIKPEPQTPQPAEQMSPEQRIDRLLEILANPEVRQSLENLLAKSRDEVLQ